MWNSLNAHSRSRPDHRTPWHPKLKIQSFVSLTKIQLSLTKIQLVQVFCHFLIANLSFWWQYHSFIVKRKWRKYSMSSPCKEIRWEAWQHHWAGYGNSLDNKMNLSLSEISSSDPEGRPKNVINIVGTIDKVCVH